MILEVLVSTMNQKDYSLIKTMNILSDAVIINQTDYESIEYLNYLGHKIKWINTTERGLSKSRNMAIKNAKADICLLADDDEVFNYDYPQILENAFVVNKDKSIIRFAIKGIERKYKEYSPKRHNIGYFKSFHISSVETAFRLKDILEKKLKFNEYIGAGTTFLMGEENAFLVNCIKQKLKICYEPYYIANLHLGNSSWFSGYDEKYFIGKGAAFTAMDRNLANILILQFAIRKYKIYKNEMHFLNSIKYMLKGKKEYNNISKKYNHHILNNSAIFRI